jgi:hypothetical protein
MPGVPVTLIVAVFVSLLLEGGLDGGGLDDGGGDEGGGGDVL